MLAPNQFPPCLNMIFPKYICIKIFLIQGAMGMYNNTNKRPSTYSMHSMHEADLDVDMPPEAQNAHIFPNLKNGNLIPISKFCDAGHIAFFRKNTFSSSN